MASVNKVTLIGNLGRDPEVRYAPSGSAICNVTIATSRNWKDKTSGERHGAIRIGRPDEYRWIARFFAQFAMEPHNFYDMASVGAKSQPVIATAYSGNLDFTRPENTLLVDYHLTPVRDGEYLEWEGQHWAEPSVEHAAAHMRRLYDDRAFASALGARGQKTVLEEYSVRAAGARIRSRLDAINANLVGQPHQARRVRYLRRSGVA